MAAETGTAEGSRRPRRFTFSDEAPAPQSAPAPSASSTAIPPRQGFSAATPPPSYGGFSQQPRPLAPAVHQPPAAGWPQQNWGTAPAAGWGAGAGAGLAGPGDGWGGDAWAGGWGPGDGWAGWGQGAWGKGGGGGAGAFGGPPMFGTVLIGTVKSYSAVKGFGFLIHPDIPQDIWFAKETVAAELRTSDLAGTAMAFELMRAPDGKPQARNLRPAPAGAGMPPPPVNPNHHPHAAHAMPGFRPGMPGHPGLAGCPGLVRPGFPGAVRPLGAMGVGVGVPLGGGQPKRRAWSPHAGSRAIATASLEEGQAGVPPPVVEEKAPPSEEEKSPSSRRTSEESSESSSERRRKKKKKDKKKKKKKKKKSKKSGSSSSVLEAEEVRSSSRSRSPKKVGEHAGAKGKTTSPAIEQAKLEALEKLRKLQSVEPKEARAKEWRALLRDWHPDKNPDNIEVAKEVFQFLQKGKTIINV